MAVSTTDIKKKGYLLVFVVRIKFNYGERDSTSFQFQKLLETFEIIPKVAIFGESKLYILMKEF